MRELNTKFSIKTKTPVLIDISQILTAFYLTNQLLGCRGQQYNFTADIDANLPQMIQHSISLN